MDPQLKSALTSVLLVVCTAATGWAATHGVISQGDTATLANALVLVVGSIITAGVGWYKARQVAPAALIQAVNRADNGVKVVPSDSTLVQPVDKPVK